MKPIASTSRAKFNLATRTHAGGYSKIREIIKDPTGSSSMEGHTESYKEETWNNTKSILLSTPSGNYPELIMSEPALKLTPLCSFSFSLSLSSTCAVPDSARRSLYIVCRLLRHGIAILRIASSPIRNLWSTDQYAFRPL